MNKYVYLKCISFCCLLFCLYPSLNGQTALVEVTPITRYTFEVRSVSDYPIEVHIDDSISFRLLPFPWERSWKRLDKSQVTKASVMQLQYTQTDAMMVNNDIIRRLAEYQNLAWAQNVVNDFWGKLLSGTEVSLSEIAVSKVDSATTIQTWLKEKLDLFEQDLRINADLLAASNGVENQFRSNFDVVPIYDFTVDKTVLTPLVNIIWDFPISKQDLGAFWGKRSTNTTSELQVSVGLKPELRWGKGNMFSSIHGFFSIYRPSYGLLPEEDIFFVGDSYVEESRYNVVELLTGDFINLNVNQLSGGVIIRTLFYPKFFFDIGGGYTFHQSTRLHFDPEDEEGNEIFHLPDGVFFERQKTKNIADVELRRLYGLLRVGWNLSAKNDLSSAKGFYLTGTIKTFYEPTIIENEGLRILLLGQQ